MKRLVIIIFQVNFYLPLCSQLPAWSTDATPLHRAEKALTDVIVHDVFSPPVASRIYVYANMAAYEVFAHTDPGYHSLHGQLRSFPSIPAPAKKILPSLAAVYSLLTIGRQLVFSDSLFGVSENAILHWFLDKKMDKQVYLNSIGYGRQVADSISKWLSKDHYRETRSLRRYTYLKQDGKWTPTPPGYFAAVEPYWNRIRCLTMDSANQFKPAPLSQFSKEKGSEFYNQAEEVFKIGKSLSAEQKAIASFWDCNPFDLNTNGHLFFASKKISPGGHWINITGIACIKTNADMGHSAAAYTMVSIALFDAFISCWDEKYRSNNIRPETYIDKYIDESWRPLLQTPPFPEYTSGHSVVSTASAVILTDIFGDHFSYTDSTESEFNLPARHFGSFMDAANEAAISRIYGGIHYSAAVVNGQVQGEKIGRYVLQKIQLLKKDDKH